VSGVAVCGNGDMLLACVRATGELVARSALGSRRGLVSSMITSPGRGVRSGFLIHSEQCWAHSQLQLQRPNYSKALPSGFSG
jgi:hypothetical protein